MLFAAVFLAVASVWTGVHTLQGHMHSRLATVLETLESGSSGAQRGGAFRPRMRDAGRSTLTALGERLTALHWFLGSQTEERLRWTAVGWSVNEFLALRVLSSGGGLVLGLVFALLWSAVPAMVALALLGAVIGYSLPDQWLSYRVRRHREAIDRELLSFLDLLTLAAEAGLSIEQAITMASEELPGIVAHGFGVAIRERAMGQWTEHAWSDLADRMGHADLRLVLETIGRAGRFGARTATALRDIAETIRARRSEDAREHASRAGAAVVLPLAVFIMPAIVVLLAYPAFVSLAPAFGAG